MRGPLDREAARGGDGDVAAFERDARLTGDEFDLAVRADADLVVHAGDGHALIGQQLQLVGMRPQGHRAIGRLDLQPALVGVEAGGLARGDGRGVGGRGLQVLLRDLAQALAAELLHAGRGGQQLGRGAVQHHGGLGEGGDRLALAGVSSVSGDLGLLPVDLVRMVPILLGIQGLLQFAEVLALFGAGQGLGADGLGGL